MKYRRILPIASIHLVLTTAAIQAQTPLYKVNNTSDLNQTVSWTDIPGLANPPASISSSAPLYFNEVNMQGNKTVALGGDLVVGGLALDWATGDQPNNLVITAGGTLTLNGATLFGSGVAGTGGSYTGAGIVLNRGTGGTLSISSNVALGAAQQWVTGRSSGTPLDVSGDINLGANNLRLVMVGPNSTNTLSGVISGTGRITKENTAVLNISGNNPFSGGFQLGPDGGAANTGVVNVGHANALGSGTVTIRGTQLRSSVAGLAIPNNFNMGAGGLRLGGANNFSISGTLAMDAASRTIANYGTASVTLGNVTTVSGSVLAFDNAAGGGSGAPIVVNGVISGPGGVAMSGNQFTTFNGVNTYAGTTTMSGGRIAGSGVIPTVLTMSGGSFQLAGGATTGGALTLAAGATFTNTPAVVFSAPPQPATPYDVFNYSGTLGGLANLKSTLRGSFTDTGSKVTFTLGDQNQGRTWNVTSGNWDGTGANANWLEGDNLFFNGDSAIFPEPASAATVTLSGTISANGFAVSNTSNAYTFTGGSLTGTTGLAKSGAGAMTIGNGHTFTGNVLVSGGTVTGTGGVPSANAHSSFGLKSNTRTITVENPGTTVWLTAINGGSNTFGGGGMTPSQVPTLVVKDSGVIRTGKFNTVGNIILQNGGSLTSSTTETSGSYGGYQFIGLITASGTGTGTFIDLNGSTRPNHLNGGATTTFDVADLTGSGAADLTVSAPLANGSGDYSGTGSLTKSGQGTLVLSAANTYSGTTTVAGGTLELSGTLANGAGIVIDPGTTFAITGSSTLGAGGSTSTAIANNGTLSVASSASLTYDGTLAGSGSLIKSGAGTLTFSGSSLAEHTGPTTVTGGTLIMNGYLRDSNVTVSGSGTLAGTGTIEGDVTIGSGGSIVGNGTAFGLEVGSLTFDSTATVQIGALENFTNFAAIDSLGTLAAKGGSGSVTINLPAGPIAAGTYKLISSANTLASTAAFVLGTKPALGSRQSGLLVANSGSLDYRVSGVNPVWTGDFSGEWSTTILASPKNWFTNVQTDYIDGDAVTFNDSAAGTTAVTLNTTVTPASVIFDHGIHVYSVTGSGAIAGTGSLTKSGGETLTIGTANTYSGGTIVNGGTLALDSGASLGSGAIALNGGTLKLAGHTLANPVATAGGTLGGTTFQIDGVISGTSLGIQASGIVKFNAVNTYTGATDIISGGLDLIGASQFNSGDYSGAINNPALLRFNTTADQILRGSISGNGQLVKNLGSTLELFAQNSHTGGTTINGGTVKLSGGGGFSGTIRGTATLSGSGTSLWLNTGDATGYAGDGTSLTTINLGEGTNLHNNMDARIGGGNQTLGNAVVNMTGASITGVTGSNLDFFAGASAINTFASATTSTISGTALDLRQSSGVTFTIADGPAAVDLGISSLMTNRAPSANGPGTGASYGNHPLIKAGDGLMKLTGASNYTGNTTVNGGVLDVTSGQIYTGAYQGTAVITINSGATLRITNLAYNEVAGSAASLGGLRDYGNARVINGGTFEVLGAGHSTGNNFNVTAGGGIFRFDPPEDTSTLTLGGNGNSNIVVNGALTLDAVGNVTVTEVIEGTGTLNKTGAGVLTLGGVNTRSGPTTVTAGTLAVNGTSLSDAASLAIDGGVVNLTGSETVDSLYFGAALQLAGTWGATGSGAQHIDDTRFSGSGLLNVVNGTTPSSGYNSWAAINAPAGGPSEDYDGDGVPNAVEFVLGGTKGTNDLGRLPTIAMDGTNVTFTFVRNRQSIANGTEVSIKVGTDLVNWPVSHDVPDAPVVAVPGVSVVDNLDGTDTVTLSIPRAPDLRKFARLVVEIN